MTQFTLPMRIHTMLFELAEATFLKILAYLRLIVAEERADILLSGERLRHRVGYLS